jgi:hypothetical protein
MLSKDHDTLARALHAGGYSVDALTIGTTSSQAAPSDSGVQGQAPGTTNSDNPQSGGDRAQSQSGGSGDEQRPDGNPSEASYEVAVPTGGRGDLYV